MISELEEKEEGLQDPGKRNLQFVRRGNTHYYRKKPSTDEEPAPGQLRSRVAFGRAAYDAYGKEDPRQAVRDRMKGKEYSEKTREPIEITPGDILHYRRDARLHGYNRVVIDVPVILNGQLYEKGVVLVFS